MDASHGISDSSIHSFETKTPKLRSTEMLRNNCSMGPIISWTARGAACWVGLEVPKNKKWGWLFEVKNFLVGNDILVTSWWFFTNPFFSCTMIESVLDASMQHQTKTAMASDANTKPKRKLTSQLPVKPSRSERIETCGTTCLHDCGSHENAS